MFCIDRSPAAVGDGEGNTLPRCIDDGNALSSQRWRLLAFGSRMKTVEEFPEDIFFFDVFLSLSGGRI